MENNFIVWLEVRNLWLRPNFDMDMHDNGIWGYKLKYRNIP